MNRRKLLFGIGLGLIGYAVYSTIKDQGASQGIQDDEYQGIAGNSQEMIHQMKSKTMDYNHVIENRTKELRQNIKDMERKLNEFKETMKMLEMK